MGKGSVNERHLRDCYENAGYRVYRPATVRFGENDMWGLFDLACLRPGKLDAQANYEVEPRLVLVQCKTNRASGIKEWYRHAEVFTDVPGVTVAYDVRVDREGWRHSEYNRDAKNGYTWLYDGRDTDHCIGDGLTQYLKGER